MCATGIYQALLLARVHHSVTGCTDKTYAHCGMARPDEQPRLSQRFHALYAWYGNFHGMVWLLSDASAAD